jgi:hypothetical protein
MKKAKIGKGRSLLLQNCFIRTVGTQLTDDYIRGVVDALIVELMDSGMGFTDARESIIQQSLEIVSGIVNKMYIMRFFPVRCDLNNPMKKTPIKTIKKK